MEATQSPARPSTFTVAVIAGDPADAITRTDRVLARLDGFETTGRARVTDARHLLCEVEVTGHGDVNDAWVTLTSFGITPAHGLGSVWQTVAGVGQ